MLNLKLISYLAELESIAEAVTGVACYLVASSELDMRLHPNIGGFFAQDMSPIIREKLPNRFQGIRPTIVVNSECYTLEMDLDDRIACRAIVGHEYTHVCELWSPELATAEQANPVALTIEIQTQILIEPTTWSSPKLPAWIWHNERFIRALAHVKHRMDRARFPVAPNLAFPPALYDLRRTLGDYSKALGGELEDRAGEPIATILASEPPKAFSRMWAEDSGQTRPLTLVASRVQ